MDLQTLTFKVETGKLKEAAEDLLALSTAVGKLNAPIEKLAKKSKDNASAVKEVSESSDKLAKSSDDASQSIDKIGKVLAKEQTRLDPGFRWCCNSIR